MPTWYEYRNKDGYVPASKAAELGLTEDNLFQVTSDSFPPGASFTREGFIRDDLDPVSLDVDEEGYKPFEDPNKPTKLKRSFF